MYKYLRELDPDFELQAYGEITNAQQVTAVNSAKDALQGFADAMQGVGEKGKSTDEELTTVLNTVNSLSASGFVSEGLTDLQQMFEDGSVTAEKYDEAMTQEANTIFEEANAIYDKYKKEWSIYDGNMTGRHSFHGTWLILNSNSKYKLSNVDDLYEVRIGNSSFSIELLNE